MKTREQQKNDDNDSDQASRLIKKIKSLRWDNEGKYWAAAALIVKKQSVSEDLLESYFGWGSGFVNDAVKFLERNKLIGEKKLFRKRKILVDQEYIDLILSDYFRIHENLWITKSFINIRINGQDVICNMNPEYAMQLNIGDKWIVRKHDLNPSTIGKPFLEMKDQEIFSSGESVFLGKYSRICFIKITERLFHENTLELHGRYVPADGVFYH